jgi:dCMP deaminase
METINKIDKLLMTHALHVATQSDDTRKVGAVLYFKDTDTFIEDFNRFPEGVQYESSRCEKPLKYKWYEHAERNVIYKAAQHKHVSTKNSTMYSTYFPCVDCTRAIIQAGIKRLVVNKEPDYKHATWGNDWTIANEMLHESNIETTFLT